MRATHNDAFEGDGHKKLHESITSLDNPDQAGVLSEANYKNNALRTPQNNEDLFSSSARYSNMTAPPKINVGNLGIKTVTGMSSAANLTSEEN